MYQILAKDLMPWIVKAEKYCATELPKCSSLEEAKELYALHQVSSMGQLCGLWVVDSLQLRDMFHFN
ncbi:hypothetical protein DPMN_186637 [Dreissena polymorpha]|uniref:Uncharacterized protein n=1 Tax=Dreissena polymorpha TaxID=45954 RepID=A0A9D4DQP4_DREPO|nr:hypothetical protein DPMN_186637 [Dreissena polymorpha]